MTQPRYLSPKDMAAYLSVSRNMVDRLVDAGKLPKPVYLTPKLPRWDREKVDAAIGRTAKSTDTTLEAIDAWFERDSKAPAQGRVD